MERIRNFAETCYYEPTVHFIIEQKTMNLQGNRGFILGFPPELRN